MASHTLVSDEARSRRARTPPRNTVNQLGWPQYWLLTVMLGGMLALVALVFLIAAQT